MRFKSFTQAFVGLITNGKVIRKLQARRLRNIPCPCHGEKTDQTRLIMETLEYNFGIDCRKPQNRPTAGARLSSQKRYEQVLKA